MSTGFELVKNPLAASASAAGSGSATSEEEAYVEPIVHAGKGHSSIAGATANLVNCVVGAGIIGLPAAVRQCGFFMGAVSLVTVAYLLYRSAIYLVQCGEKLGKHNFESLAEHLFGPLGYYVTTASMAIFAYGGMTAYMVILGDTLPPVMSLVIESAAFSSREFLVIISATFIMLPICMLKSLSDMVWASALSVLADAALICIILTEGPAEAARQNIEMDSSHFSFIKPGVFAGIGTMSFAFVCHHNSFIIYKTLKEPTLENWSSVAKYTALIALVFALTLALGGYILFNDHVEGDILNNFESNGGAITTGKLLLAMCMVLTYPVECFIARHCVNSVIDYYRSRPYDNLANAMSSDKSDVSKGDETEIVLNSSLNSGPAPSAPSPGGRGRGDIEDSQDDSSSIDRLNGGPTPPRLSVEDEATPGDDDGTGPDGSSKLTISNLVLHGDHSFFRSNTWHVIITLILWGSTTLLSLVFTDLEIVLSFTGNTTCCMLLSFFHFKSNDLMLMALFLFSSYRLYCCIKFGVYSTCNIIFRDV
jgi:amino acid permease